MKNTKMLFLISFFGCFILPIFMVMFAALSIFFDMSGPVSDWVLIHNGFWALMIYQIIIVLITIMLYQTLKLKSVELITTERVVRGRRTEVTIKKVAPLDLGFNSSKPKRKKVKVLEARDIEDSSLKVPIRELKRDIKKKHKENSKVITNQPTAAPKPVTKTTPKKIYPIRK